MSPGSAWLGSGCWRYVLKCRELTNWSNILRVGAPCLRLPGGCFLITSGSFALLTGLRRRTRLRPAHRAGRRGLQGIRSVEKGGTPRRHLQGRWYADFPRFKAERARGRSARLQPDAACRRRPGQRGPRPGPASRGRISSRRSISPPKVTRERTSPNNGQLLSRRRPPTTAGTFPSPAWRRWPACVIARCAGRSPAHTFTSATVVPFDLSYELDIWGRVRRAFEASRRPGPGEPGRLRERAPHAQGRRRHELFRPPHRRFRRSTCSAARSSRSRIISI